MTVKELYNLGFILEIHTTNIDLYETGLESNFANENVETIMDDYYNYTGDLESEYHYDFAETKFNLLDLDGNLVLNHCSYDDIERYVENL